MHDLRNAQGTNRGACAWYAADVVLFRRTVALLCDNTANYSFAAVALAWCCCSDGDGAGALRGLRVTAGTKRWILYPLGKGFRSKVRGVIQPLAPSGGGCGRRAQLTGTLRSHGESPATIEHTCQITAREWLREKVPELQRHELGDLGTPVEVLTHGGDVILVPKDWSHGTLTVEAGIAIAQEVHYAPMHCNERNPV